MTTSEIVEFERGFPDREFEERLARAQKLLSEKEFDALLICTEADFQYFSGFNSYFWQSPTRPWFLIVPSNGSPIAVIPSIGENAVSTSWITDLRVWASPNPDDEGISLLADTLRSVSKNSGRIGILSGPETHLRFPANDFDFLKKKLSGKEFVDATEIIRKLRMVKSEREIAKHARVCGLVSDAYENVSSIIQAGMTEFQARNAFRIDVLSRGADSAPYIITTSGKGAADDAIRFPTDRELASGDVVFIDTGAEIDGYFSDFDRNFAIGHADDQTRFAYELVYKATDAGIAAAKVGTRVCDVWNVMNDVLVAGGSTGGSVGRMGHGVGLRNTEWPSIMASDETVLQPGMVMAIEPGYDFAPGKMMLHEENVVIREDGPQMISRRAEPEIPIL